MSKHPRRASGKSIGAPRTIVEYFYTMISRRHGFMEISDASRELIAEDRERALQEPDEYSEVSVIQSRETIIPG